MPTSASATTLSGELMSFFMVCFSQRGLSTSNMPPSLTDCQGLAVAPARTSELTICVFAAAVAFPSALCKIVDNRHSRRSDGRNYPPASRQETQHNPGHFCGDRRAFGRLQYPGASTAKRGKGQLSGKITAAEWGGVWDNALQVVSPGFTKDTGVDVVNSVNSGSVLAVLEQNPGLYDLGWVIGTTGVQAYEKGLTQAIDTSKIDNFDSLNPVLVDAMTVDDKLTSVPISFGTMGNLHAPTSSISRSMNAGTSGTRV